ncbi:hypothetical protein BGW41_003286 [Actinomortierella wolfii]|nr:hypothetical protein BGW41_003286 [Actinomortierella wolfii]
MPPVATSSAPNPPSTMLEGSTPRSPVDTHSPSYNTLRQDPRAIAANHTEAASPSQLPPPPTTTTTTTTITSAPQTSSLRDRIRAEEHRFTSLTQNLTHFSPLKAQLDKHNVTIGKLEADIAKRNNIMRKCQDKLKTLAKRPPSKQASRVSLNATNSHSTESSEAEEIIAKHQRAKEELDALNDQLLAAKILIFVGSTPEHPEEDELEQEIKVIGREMDSAKSEFDRLRSAKKELKEVKRYLDIWNDTMEKQLASQPKDVSKSFKKLVPFFGPKAPSYTKVADQHYKEALAQVPTLENIGNLSDISMESTAATSSELILYTSKFNQVYTTLTKQLEDVYKKHTDLRTRRTQRIEDLFNIRCRVFSEELQEYYRSVGASLAAGENVDASLEGDVDSEDVRLRQESRALLGLRRHVEDETGATSSTSGTTEPDSSLPPADELPSYWQYHQDGGAVVELGPRTLATSSRNSTVSSTTSINMPLGYNHGLNMQHHHHSGETSNNPPDYAVGGLDTASSRTHEDEMFIEYHRRYDTQYAGAMDTPPCYEEAAPRRVVDPV